MNLQYRVREFVSSEKAMETVEYAVIIGLIVAAALIALAAIGVWVSSVYSNAQATLGA